MPGHLVPEDVAEVALPPLDPERVLRGLVPGADLVDSEEWPERVGIVSWAPMVERLVRLHREAC